MSQNEEKILKQMEFYFSDSNLPNDKFLRSQVANHNEGFVSLDIICSFSRMQQLTKNQSDVVSAIKKSSMLELDKDEKMVRRKTQLPETISMDERSAYVKGLPLDGTFDSIQPLFKDFKVFAIRLRRNRDTGKTFKGSAFVEFETEDELKKFLSSEFKVGESVLQTMEKKKMDCIR